MIMRFVSLKLANKLKKKGFREECLCHYIGEDLVYNIESPIANNQLWCSHNKYDNIWHRDNVDAPTISQVLEWLRKIHKLHIEFVAAAYGYNIIISQTPEAGGTDYYFSHNNYDGPNDGGAWDDIEDAALFGINYVLDNLI